MQEVVAVWAITGMARCFSCEIVVGCKLAGFLVFLLDIFEYRVETHRFLTFEEARETVLQGVIHFRVEVVQVTVHHRAVY